MPRVILPNVALLLHRFVGLSRFNYLCFFQPAHYVCKQPSIDLLKKTCQVLLGKQVWTQFRVNRLFECLPVFSEKKSSLLYSAFNCSVFNCSKATLYLWPLLVLYGF